MHARVPTHPLTAPAPSPPQLGIAQPLTPLVDEFADKLFKEMDYVMEGRNCERFRELYCTPALPR